ncbi:hypothetical protein DFP73DRAFT_524013 [Morchella snyderi]|nr:hypothetical protein DFP73DRAFT_524013 [Morchella snyderi]
MIYYEFRPDSICLAIMCRPAENIAQKRDLAPEHKESTELALALSQPAGYVVNIRTRPNQAPLPDRGAADHPHIYIIGTCTPRGTFKSSSSGGGQRPDHNLTQAPWRHAMGETDTDTGSDSDSDSDHTHPPVNLLERWSKTVYDTCESTVRTSALQHTSTTHVRLWPGRYAMLVNYCWMCTYLMCKHPGMCKSTTSSNITITISKAKLGPANTINPPKPKPPYQVHHYHRDLKGNFSDLPTQLLIPPTYYALHCKLATCTRHATQIPGRPG